MPHDEAQAIQELLSSYARLFGFFEAEGEELVIVGGAVRDLIAAAALPAKLDVDFATSALPEKTIEILKKNKLRFFTTGIRFGTISTIHADSGRMLELTTYRPDESYTPGSRKPEVSFGTSLEADLIRRDLSINAMALRGDGSIVDLFGGREAIAARRLEVPGGGLERTRIILRDDPLRILRIARFAARLDYRATDDTTTAATECAPWLQSISHERWKAELDKLLIAPQPAAGLRWLQQTGALREVLPEVLPLLESADFDRWCEALQQLPTEPHHLRWGWLLLGAAIAGAEADDATSWPEVAVRQQTVALLADRLKWSNEERQVVGELIALPLSTAQLAALPELELRRWIARTEPRVADQCALLVALGHLGSEGAALAPFLARVEALSGEASPVPQLPLGFGKVLMTELGLQPGPAVGQAVEAVKQAIIDGLLPNQGGAQDYLAWLRNRAATDA
ncbi:MAG: CCA tRNA nucleotidyltransferase [Deltaproteobacteria bacterium]|nr:CCA tRNA nucleotidyltransferase [Deltaproteobacteria bacterium]